MTKETFEKNKIENMKQIWWIDFFFFLFFGCIPLLATGIGVWGIATGGLPLSHSLASFSMNLLVIPVLRTFIREHRKTMESFSPPKAE